MTDDRPESRDPGSPGSALVAAARAAARPLVEKLLPDPTDGPLTRLKDTFTSS